MDTHIDSFVLLSLSVFDLHSYDSYSNSSNQEYLSIYCQGGQPFSCLLERVKMYIIENLGKFLFLLFTKYL